MNPHERSPDSIASGAAHEIDVPIQATVNDDRGGVTRSARASPSLLMGPLTADTMAPAVRSTVVVRAFSTSTDAST